MNFNHECNIFKFLATLFLLLLTGCQHSETAPKELPFIGSWRVIEGMTPEDSKAGFMEVIFSKNGKYNGRYISPDFQTEQKANWKLSSDNMLIFSNVTLSEKAGKKQDPHLRQNSDFSAKWEINQAGHLVLERPKTSLVLKRVD